MQGSFDILEQAIVPSLLANCGSSVGISKSSLKILDGLHKLFCRLVFSCPGSTPVPAFRGQAGLQDFEHRVMTQKVSLVTMILHGTNDPEENYAHEILQEQLLNAWDGITKDVQEMCKRVGLPDACLQYVFKVEIKIAMQLSNAKTPKEQIIGLSKQEHLVHKDLRFSQDYVKTKSLEDARLEFRWQTGMLDNRANMGRRYSSKTCPHCEDGHDDGAIESTPLCCR